ncbi:hypothetical protein N7508_000717 [Penicillium antarcticum]|uniref:uncharacterized protein n=1 Tax=Penicillium antarcticum TaxID=416450 RepID=UPI00239CDEA4|nr:uncharacterized protein N7508_000717 [Penicillium antarcticum]KAJ5320434.1 hypothetical protein N7508_000717 [Penicillium antarcticum]
MTRGNQRDNDRAKAQKKAAASVRLLRQRRKGKNTQSGSQYQKSKEDAAAIMREKQKKGVYYHCAPRPFGQRANLFLLAADEKRAAEAGGKK